MPEKIKIYDLNGNLLRIENRNIYYNNIRNLKNPKTKIKTVRVLMLNPKGRIYLQKRSNQKSENPGLYDKTIGGHVNADESNNLTVVKECAEELGIPATTVKDNEFENAIASTNLSTIAIIKKIDNIELFKSMRKIKNNRTYHVYQETTIYIGYYDGSIKFMDGESSGIEVFSLKELEKEINQNPRKFTEDIKFMIKKYRNYIKPL